jgi:hypothetical protein
MVIPIGDEPSGVRTPPYVVYGLIVINVLVWLLQLQIGEAFTNGWSTVPYEITHGEDLTGTRTVEAGGEAFPVRLYRGPTPIYLTLLSAMFMHGSWLHILGNMLYLWIFGDQIEHLLGRGRFIVFYYSAGWPPAWRRSSTAQRAWSRASAPRARSLACWGPIWSSSREIACASSWAEGSCAVGILPQALAHCYSTQKENQRVGLQL